MESVSILSTVVLPFVNFFLFLIVLYFLGRRPLSEMQKKKQADFLEKFQAAQSAKKAADERLDKVNERLNQLDEEIREILLQGKEDSKRECEVIRVEAEQLVAHIKREAASAAAAEIAAARRDLNNEALEAIRQASLAKSRQELTAASQKALLARATAVIEN